MVDLEQGNDVALLFGIVTYKEKYFECESFISLLRSYRESNDKKPLNIVVIDNTDSDGWNVDHDQILENINIIYYNLNNPGISVAYNRINSVALGNGYKWVVLLDQDTELPSKTYEIYKSKAIENNNLYPIKIPVVYSSNRILSPSLYRYYRSFSLQKVPNSILKTENHSWINSGMMVSTEFFNKVGGYNEKLKLDFCDHDFVEKTKNFCTEVEILDLHLKQNFSADLNDKNQSITRFKIFSKDIREFYRNRKLVPLFFLVDLPHLLRLSLKYKTLDFLHLRLKK